MTIKHLFSKLWKPYVVISTIIGTLGSITLIYSLHQKNLQLSKQLTNLTIEKTDLGKQLTALKNQDQYLRNKQLEANIKAIEKSFKATVFLSISSFKIFGQNLLKAIVNKRVRKGDVMLRVDTNVTGPKEAE